MKNTQKMAVLGSALGLILVSGAFAAEDRMMPTLHFGESPTMYDQLRIEQHRSDMATAQKGARGPVRTESMEERALSFGESPSNYQAPISTQQGQALDDSR